MKSCREVRSWLEWLAAEEIDGSRRRAVMAHVSACPRCRQELADWRALLAAAAEPDATLQAEMQAVDWDALRETIVAGAGQRRVCEGRVAPGFPIALLAAAAALAVVVGLGLFFLARSRGGVVTHSGGNGTLSASVSRLQSSLAREETVSYLQQSQMMLTGLLKDCASEEMAPWEMQLASRQAKALLLKKKYFQPHLSELEWAKVRPVSERIDWLSYEILQLEDRQLCDQVARLQRIMEREKLLLKIRLVESEFAGQPVQEA